MKSLMDISDLTPSAVYSKHNKSFGSFRELFSNLYENYPNKEKILTLLDYWIFNIFILKELYGEAGLISFCDGNVSNPQRFSFLYESSIVLPGSSLPRYKKNKSNLLSFLLKKIYIPGATLSDLGSKLLNKISANYIQSIPEIENTKLKNNIFKLIDQMMIGYISPKEIDKVKSKLPKIFYSEIVCFSHNKEILVEGSSASFMEFSGIEKLFLLNRKIKVEGFQHGGGYDIFKIDYFVEYEKKLTDIFFGWGFSKNNKHQKKYKKLKKTKNEEKIKRRILWIEDSSLPSFYFASMPHHHYPSINKTTKSYIYDELNFGNFQYSNLFHPSAKSELYDSFRKDSFFLSSKGPSENLIKQNDILIFDNPGSSLIHFAIENNIVFYKIIDKDDFNNFTSIQREFFLILRKHGFGLYNDEKGKMYASLMEINLNTNHSLPLDLLEYYKITFLNP